MKNESITIRIEDVLKKDFQDICIKEHTDMSDKLYEHIVAEVKLKKVKTIESNIEDMLKSLGYNNVFIVNAPMNEIDGKVYQVGNINLTSKFTLLDFIKLVGDRKLYLYLLGSHLPDMIRCFTIDNIE